MPRVGSTMNMWPGIDLEIDRPGQWVETLSQEPDPEWRFVDAQGHGHFVDPKATGDARFPTLIWVSQPCTMGHDDCTAEGDWTCSLCGEIVDPATRAARPIFISGPTNYRLTVRRSDMVISYSGFGPDQLDAAANAVTEAIQAALGDYAVEVLRTGP